MFSQMVTMASGTFQGMGWHSSGLIWGNVSQQGFRVGMRSHMMIIQIKIGSFSLGTYSLGSWQISKNLGSDRSSWPQAVARWSCLPRPRNTSDRPGSCPEAAEEESGVFNFLLLENSTLYIKICVHMSLSHLPLWAAWLPLLPAPHTHTLTVALWALFLLGFPWCSFLQTLTCVKMLLSTGGGGVSIWFS